MEHTKIYNRYCRGDHLEVEPDVKLSPEVPPGR